MNLPKYAAVLEKVVVVVWLSVFMQQLACLISNFRRVLNFLLFLLGNSPAPVS
jgi:hypothetical protein